MYLDLVLSCCLRGLVGECLCDLVTVFGDFGGCLVFCSLAVGCCWWRC